MIRVPWGISARILNHLKAAGLRTHLLLTFGAPRLEHKRFVQG